MILPDHIRLSAWPENDLREVLTVKNYSRVSVLVDENTKNQCYPRLKQSLPAHQVITIPAGEQYKTIETCMQVWKAMTDQQLDRHSVLIVVGGGVAGDLGGFCASTFKRGIDFILIPTTLLAMADASIGGKVGVDLGYYKNQIGVFREPAYTILSTVFLNTLPEKELRSGFAEVIKHALISDKPLWDIIRVKSWKSQEWNSLVQHSATLKWRVVQHDPHEKGLRKILNAGHTIGHAIETHFLAKGQPVLHGEAIAAGLICESKIAAQKGLITRQDMQETSSYLLSVFGKLSLPEHPEEIAKLCYQDKKNKDNRVLMALLDGIGRARWDVEASMAEMVDSLTYYSSLHT
ncbi:MAG: 3-dehydroquinate synthase [Flammeovirgaceae bacterium]|nr:MAG: 3-dehydroquinate synthase [Flammeovirgaceae bacterium]